ncbi:MAG: amidohydrolase family protein [Thermomicrobiales bacterium]
MGARNRIIDAHTHLFAPAIVRDRSAYLTRDGWFGALYASPKIVLVTPEDLIESMDATGIEMSIVCGWPWTDMGLCREHNDFLAEVQQRFPDRIAWLAIVNPASPEAPAEIERAVKMGASGIGELNADAQGFNWERHAELAGAMDACLEFDVPVLMHCSEPVGHAYPGKGTATPEKILNFLEANPDLRVVAAHWGGGLPFYELMPEVALLTANVTYDSAASTYLYGFDVFPVVERLIGNQRAMFGTDFPLLKQGVFLDRVLRSGMPQESLPGLLGETAARVFKLGQKVATR